MAVPAWAIAGTTDVMLDASADGNFSAFGGGAAGLQVETEYFIEGANCESKDAWASALKGMSHDENAVDLAVGTDEVAMVWQIYHIPNSMTDNSGGGETGMQVRAGTDVDSNYWYFNVGDNETLLFETWVPWVINWDNSLETGTVGTPSGTIDWIGGGVDVSAAGPTKGAPFGIDAIRYGRFEIDYTDGQAANYNTFAKAEAFGNANARRWGVLELVGGTFRMQGFHSFGTSGTAVDFRDSDVVLFIRDTPFAPAGFNRFEVINASSNVDWTNILITALGTQSPGVFVVTSGAFDAIACQFTDMGTFDFLSSSSATNTVFRGCDTITAPGTDLQGTQVVVPVVAADTAAVVWDTATDTDALLDGMSFESHGSTLHHAIEFTTFATSFDLVGIDFTGFSASTDNNGSALYFPDTGSDRAWVVNLIGCTGTITSKKVRAGDTVSLVIDPVPLTLTVTSGGTPISGARAFVEVTNTAGGYPFEASVSITQAAGVATVDHTAHGLTTNDYVRISGSTIEGYNKVGQITVTDVDTYTYAVDSGLASPATGSPVSTFVIINGTTNGSGVITSTYSYTADQPFTGRVRDSTSPSPYYKTSPLTGTVDSAAGLSLPVQMILDE